MMGSSEQEAGPERATSTTTTTAGATANGWHPVAGHVREDVEKEPVRKPIDAQIVADAGGTRLATESHPAFPRPPKRHWVRWVVLVVLAALVVWALIRFGYPAVRTMLDTVSTDDAFVSAHITNVSPRVSGLVTEVRFDQNDRVRSGDLLVRIDREPFRIALGQAEAGLQEAKANQEQARAQVRAQLAQARGSFYRRKNAQERLRQQVAALKAQVAKLKEQQSSRGLAELDQKRLDNLVKRGSATQSELDQRNNTLKVADEKVQEAWQEIQETRAALGLLPNYNDPLDLPKDLESQESLVQSSVSDIAAALAQIGIPFDPKDAEESHAFNDFLEPDGTKSAGEGLEAVIERAPAARVALAGVAKAERQVDDAKLRLSWTEIRSEIDGYVQDRQVNPGSHVEVGQTLISVRPTYVWVDANFKETQIRQVRIGQPVDLYVDAYPGKVFKGRVAGFSPGTGLSESLLPPENATGNYVKVTQRLPVRIELAGPNPDDTPLFAGLSVVPYVQIKREPTGPAAGGRLHTPETPNRPDVGRGPAGEGARAHGAVGAAGVP